MFVLPTRVSPDCQSKLTDSLLKRARRTPCRLGGRRDNHYHHRRVGPGTALLRSRSEWPGQSRFRQRKCTERDPPLDHIRPPARHP